MIKHRYDVTTILRHQSEILLIAVTEGLAPRLASFTFHFTVQAFQYRSACNQLQEKQKLRHELNKTINMNKD